MVPTKEAKAYQAQVAWLAKAAGIRQPHAGRITPCSQICPKTGRSARRDPHTWDDTVQCIDTGNCEKVLSEALNGVLLFHW
jgi:crossover junction endodeoxyribonuclease RusA